MDDRVNWIVSRVGKDFDDDQKRCALTLVEGLGSPWNIITNWGRADLSYYRGMGVVVRSELATFDSDNLTKLVLAAHRNCVRVSVEGCGPKYLRVVLFARSGRDGGISRRHPTIQEVATPDHPAG